jgi:lipoprotein-releasing system permease protein
MLRPVEFLIASRYARSREAGSFVSFITLLSLIGVAIGVIGLIVILSVMNGFEGQLRERLLSLSAHAVITRADHATFDGAALAARAATLPGVTGAAPYVELQALMAHNGAMSGVTLRGVDPRLEPSVSTIGAALRSGELRDLVAGGNRVLLGRVLAFQLGVTQGDEVTVLVPAGEADGDLVPRIQALTVAGVFEVGLQDHDAVLALASLPDVAALAGDEGEGIRLRFAQVFEAPARAAAVAGALGPGYRARDWTVEYASYFRAIGIEKTMMTLLLALAVAVAAFMIVGSLVMVVRAKRTDIAILRTLGLTPGSVVAVFLAQGTVIGGLGTLGGALIGLPLAYFVAPVAAFLERLFRFEFFASDVFYVTRIPSQVEAHDVVTVLVVAFALTLLATVYPAVRAARTLPADALRYE